MFAETIATINGAIVSRLERDFRFLAAFRANHGEHLPLFAAVAVAFAFVAAITATHRLVFEAALLIEFLFACAENKFFSAVLAHECFVFKSH